MTDKGIVSLSNTEDYIGIIDYKENDFSYPYLRLRGVKLTEELKLIKLLASSSLDESDYVDLRLYNIIDDRVDDKLVCKISPNSLILSKIKYMEPTIEFEMVYGEDDIVKIDLSDSKSILGLLSI